MRKSLAAAMAVVAFGVSLSRADLTGMDWRPGQDISSLHLADGVWTYGDDWYYILNPDGSGVGGAYEEWIGLAPVDFNIDVYTDGIAAKLHITKSVENTTGDAWTDFHIDLNPLPPTQFSFVDPGSVTSTRFSDNVVFNDNGDGSGHIDFYLDPGNGDTPVLPGEYVGIDFDVILPNAIYTPFQMVQYPTIPEPGTLALLSAGLLGLSRRRRAI